MRGRSPTYDADPRFSDCALLLQPSECDHLVVVANKHDLVDWLTEALEAHGGRGSIVELCREIWQGHEPELRLSGDLFYTWQYDVRWAAYTLRESGTLKPDAESPQGIWEIASDDRGEFE